jgi:Ser/Thr protein kinase RdoA (MazF antagonist)
MNEPNSAAGHPDIDAITPEDMRFNPPDFPAEVIAPLILAEYGLEGDWNPLDGERDQNFRLVTATGDAFVVKIAGPDEDPALTDFQVQALLHLERGSPEIPVPRLRRTSSGDCLSEVVDEAGVRHAIRVVSFLPGIPYGDGSFPDAEHLQQIGAFMAGMVNALAGFEHPASRHFMPWNLSNGVAVSRDLWANAAADVTTLAAPLLDRLRDSALPTLNALPSQVIHNDGHNYNLLRADAQAQEVVGLIDFGDMVYAPKVNDFAIPACTFQRLCPEPLYAVIELLKGFHAVHPLSDVEVSLLWDAITLRLLITVLLSDVKLQLGGKSAHDALEDRTEAMAMLASVVEMDHTATVNTLRSVCGYG